MTSLTLDEVLRKYSSYELINLGKRNIPAPREFFPDYYKNNSVEIYDYLSDKIIMPDEKISFIPHPRFSKIRRHHHSFIEMIYVYSGQCLQRINNTELLLKQGEICILNINASHLLACAGEDDIIINCAIKKDYFDTAFLSRLSSNDLFSSFFVNNIYLNKELNDYIVFHSSDSQTIQEMMIHVLCEYFEKDMCFNEMIDSYMTIIFGELLRIYKRDVNSSSYKALKGTNISDIILYVQNNYKDATLESVAKQFNFNSSYLSSIIKKLSGRNFKDILHEAKLNRACILLKTTDTTINNIINDTGYSNINFFYKKFKSYYGMTPAEYRKSTITSELN